MRNHSMLARRRLLALLAGAAALPARQDEKQRGQSGADKKARDLKLRMQYLTARAVAIREAVKSLEDRLREQGLPLDPEIAANRARMEIFMDEAEDALKAERWEDADKAMDRAEAAIEKLEAVFKGK